MDNVAYLRVSTDSQTEKYGLDVQRHKILEYCDKNGIKIDKWYVDGGYSGAKLDRPEMQNLLDDAENGLFHTVFIYKLDRMSRDVIDTLDLLYRLLPKYNVKVVSMTEDIKTENPMDKVMIGVNAIMGQYEREVIYMRTRAGMLERIKKGYWMGGGNLPYGYSYDRNDGILHPNEKASEVKMMYKLYLDGYSALKIGEVLGCSESTVISVLKHKVYLGLIEYKGNVYKGLHEPILDEETYNAVQRMKKIRSRKTYASSNYKLTGLIMCGVCGARMRYHKWAGEPKLVCYSQFAGRDYMARDRNCDNHKLNASDIENEFEEYFKNHIIDASEKKEVKSNKDVLIENVKKSKSKIKKLYNVYAENESDTLLDVIMEEEKRVKQLKEMIESEQEEPVISDIEEIKRMVDVWDSLSNKEINRLLKHCIEKIVITHDKVEVFSLL